MKRVWLSIVIILYILHSAGVIVELGLRLRYTLEICFLHDSDVIWITEIVTIVANLLLFILQILVTGDKLRFGLWTASVLSVITSYSIVASTSFRVLQHCDHLLMSGCDVLAHVSGFMYPVSTLIIIGLFLIIKKEHSATVKGTPKE